MKLLMHGFINWLEIVHAQGSPIGSPFEQAARTDVLARADAALDTALATRRAVVLFTRGVNPRAITAALVLRRANVEIEKVYLRKLDDDDFAALTRVVGQFAHAELIFNDAAPLWPERVAAAIAERKLVFFC
jgi:hypothetical protein